MAATTQVMVGKEWVKLSDSDCTLQAKGNTIVQVAINTTKPTTDAYIQLTLSEPATFAYQTAVWCRKAQSGDENQIAINIIK